MQAEFEIYLNLDKTLMEQYKQIVSKLDKYKDRPIASVEFIVERDEKNRKIIGIKYPGRKIKKRNLKRPRKNSAPWENLYDFFVAVYDKKESDISEGFTWAKLIEDFEKYKKKDKKFWHILNGLYKNNKIQNSIPKLAGIDSKLFLLAIKWMWVQEDLNYRYCSKDIESPTKYINTKKGVGRTKSFAAFVLVKYGFPFKVVRKIIPLY